MPLNSAPAVVDAESFDLKLDAARGKLHVDVAFWGGLVPSNAGTQPPSVDYSIAASSASRRSCPLGHR